MFIFLKLLSKVVAVNLELPVAVVAGLRSFRYAVGLGAKNDNSDVKIDPYWNYTFVWIRLRSIFDYCIRLLRISKVLLYIYALSLDPHYCYFKHTAMNIEMKINLREKNKDCLYLIFFKETNKFYLNAAVAHVTNNTKRSMKCWTWALVNILHVRPYRDGSRM